MSPKITIDTSSCSAVIMCECGYRAVSNSRESAWLVAAKHLKHFHGDLQAGFNARHNAYMIRCRNKKRTKPRVKE